MACIETSPIEVERLGILVASTVTVAGSVAAAVSRGVAAGAGFAAEVLTVFFDVVARRDFAFAVRTGAFGVSRSAHMANT